MKKSFMRPRREPIWAKAPKKERGVAFISRVVLSKNIVIKAWIGSGSLI
jgi:hypothetical protein